MQAVEASRKKPLSTPILQLKIAQFRFRLRLFDLKMSGLKLEEGFLDLGCKHPVKLL